MSPAARVDSGGAGVSREAFLAQVETVRRGARDPRAGVFGPGSAMWQVGREAVVFLGGGRAALLQVAHPFVAQAIADHSKTETDLTGRFARTFMAVFAIVFGDLDSALEASRRVYHVHARIHGQLPESLGKWPAGAPYRALDPDALLWVHATLLDTSVRVYELCVAPLAAAQKDALYQESRRFAALFGVPDAIMPRDWADFIAYNERMWRSNELAVGSAGRKIAHFLTLPPNPAVAPVWRWYWTITAGLLPEPLRDAFEMRLGRAGRAVFRASLATLRQTYPWVPASLRDQPHYVEAQRRLQGRPGLTIYGKIVKRAVQAGLTQTDRPRRRA